MDKRKCHIWTTNRAFLKRIPEFNKFSTRNIVTMKKIRGDMRESSKIFMGTIFLFTRHNPFNEGFC